MKQEPIPSQTTARLYQHPTVEEQRSSRLAVFTANAIDFIKFVALSLILWLITTALINWLTQPQTYKRQNPINNINLTFDLNNTNISLKKSSIFRQDIALDLPVNT